MSNTTTKQPIKVGILEISSQNRAILEFFFSKAGKSYFKEVSVDKASAYIIDYDSLGAKESWKSTFEETKKPGIIISIKEVDLPSTIWLPKPLTVKALKEAGESIREIMLNDENKRAEVIVDSDVANISQETIEEQNQRDEPQLSNLVSEEIIDIPNKPISDIILSEDSTDVTRSNNQENSVEEINIVELPEETSNEEVLPLDSLFLDEPVENADEYLSESKEPELTLSVTDVSASSANFAASTNFIDIDLSLDETSESPDELELTVSQAPIGEPEIAITSEDGDVDSLLASLISGGKDNKTANNILTKSIENEDDAASTLMDFDLESTEEEETELVDLVTLDDNTATNNKVEDPTETLTTTIDETKLENNPHSENKVEEPEKTAEEELQDLLEEIRQEAGITEASEDNNELQTYSPTTAEARWKLICGDNKNIDLHRLASYNPDNHILALIRQNIQTAKQNKKIVRLKFTGIIIVIDPETDRIYCDQSIFTEVYANVCYEPIVPEKIKIYDLDASELRLYRKKMDEDTELTHYTETFIWTTSLLTARGRLPKNTNLKSKLSLAAWPDLTRVEKIPHMMQIAAIFNMNNWSLLEIFNKSGISKEYVLAFYNAALALDMIENHETIISSESLDLKKTDNKNRNLFSRFLKKITV